MKLRSLVVGVLALVVIALIVGVAYAALNSHQKSSSSQQAIKPPSTAINNQVLAAEAASTAVNKLRQSILLDNMQRWQVVNQAVDPSQRNAVYRQLTKASMYYHGKSPLWAQWGYQTRLLAYVRSGYSVNTQAFHIVSYDGTNAQVELYEFYHWQSENSGSKDACALVIETMHLVNGSWLFVTENKPPAGQTPDLSGGGELTFNERQELFKPYLKGFYKWPPSWPLKLYISS